MWYRQSSYYLKLAVIFVAYFITARIGLKINAVSGFATLVWAPSGIALASLLLFGYRYWPGITLAAFLVNVLTGAHPAVAAGIAVGNTLEPIAGAYLLRYLVQFDKQLERVKDIAGLIIIGSMMSTTLSASIGVSSLLAGHVINTEAYSNTWLAWWIGDMLGILIVSPLLLVWARTPRAPWDFRKMIHAILPMTLLIVACSMIYLGFNHLGLRSFPFAFLISPILVYTTLQFGQRGSATATFIASCIVIAGVLHGYGPLLNGPLSQRLLVAQTFMGVTAVTFLTMAAVVAEREHTQRQRQQLMQKTELLQKQRSKLLALNKAKDEFISLASHQLRTPATGVKQYIGLLLENYAGRLTDKQRRMLDVANESNERQIHIIDDLLKVAKVDAGKVQLRKTSVDLVGLIRDIIKDHGPTFAARKQRIEFDHPKSCQGYADKATLYMVIENIIDNASKYSPTGNKIDVRLAKNKQNITIAIIDEGIGIKRTDQQKLFKKFSRIDSSMSTEVGGNGIGLYWAKKIIGLHNGTIHVSSRAGAGSTFTITFPAKK